MSEVTDVELMRRAAGGEVEAFAHIYDRHAGALLALTQRMSFATAEAQDLLHDVFLEAWQHVREYDASRASVRTWLLVRARSRALDRISRETRERNLRRSLAPGGVIAERSAPVHEERRLAVRQGLAGLDPGVRETLELTYFEGMTALEIAERMQVPEGTVKSRLARGLHRLELLLSGGGGNAE